MTASPSVLYSSGLPPDWGSRRTVSHSEAQNSIRDIFERQKPLLQIRGTSTYDTLSDFSTAAFRAYDFEMAPQGAHLVTAVNFQTALYGPLGYKEAQYHIEQIQAHAEIGDTEGAGISVLNTAKAAALGGLGAVAAPYRTLTLASAIKGIEVSASAPLLGRVTYSIGQVFGGFFSLFYVLFGILSGYRLSRVVSWRTQLSLRFLEDRFSSTHVYEVEGTKEEWADIALQQGSRWLKKQFKEIEEAPDLNAKQRKALARQFFMDHEQELVKELKERFGDEVWDDCLQRAEGDLIAAFGLGLKREFADAVKTQEAERILGKELVTKVQTHGITPAILKEVQSELNWAIAKESLFLIMGLAGVVMGVFSFIPKALYAAGSSIIWAILSGISFFFDIKSFSTWWKTGDVGSAEKWMVAISMVLAVISIIAIAAVATYFTGPLWLIVVALLMDTVWLGFNGAAAYKIATHDLKKPTLKTFLERLQQGLSDEKARLVFSRLKVEDQNEVVEVLRNQFYVISSKQTLTEEQIKRGVEELYDQRQAAAKKVKDAFRTWYQQQSQSGYRFSSASSS